MELMDEVNSILNSLHPLILRKFLNTRENRELKMKDKLKVGYLVIGFKLR